MLEGKYEIKYTFSSKNDIRNMKRYILDTFKYHELGDNFSKKIGEAIDSLRVMPRIHSTVGLKYRGYDIYIKPYRSYLVFYIVNDGESVITILRVLQERMNWKYIMRRWLKEMRSYLHLLFLFQRDEDKFKEKLLE